MHITGENTVDSYACGHLLVFYAYYWWKLGKYLCMDTFCGFLCILMMITG